MTPPLRYASAKALHDAIKVRAAVEAEHGRYDINQIRRHFAYDRFLISSTTRARHGSSRAAPACSHAFRNRRATHKTSTSTTAARSRAQKPN